jgi:hypothetical protein
MLRKTTLIKTKYRDLFPSVAAVAENLIGSEVWRRGDRVGRAMWPNGGGGRSLSARGFERGGEEMRWGMATVEYGEVRGPFYRAGGFEGRRCSEGNRRRWVRH